jgi:hypothetical protein
MIEDIQENAKNACATYAGYQPLIVLCVRKVRSKWPRKSECRLPKGNGIGDSRIAVSDCRSSKHRAPRDHLNLLALLLDVGSRYYIGH